MKNFVTPLIALLLTGATLGGYGFLTYSITKAVATIDAAKADEASLGAREDAGRAAATLLSSLGTERTALAAHVLGPEGAATAITTLEALAKRDKVTLAIGTVAVNPEDGWEKHDALSVALSVEGSWKAVTAFAAALEALPLASEVESVDLSASKSTWFGTFTILFLQEKS